MQKLETLAIVMPVYNEQDAIEVVVSDWANVLSQLDVNASLHVYNDGSKDNTSEVLNQLKAKYPILTVHNKANSGHGPTILLGYREQMEADWIFQVDSDNEMRAESFKTLWEKRKDYDFLIGYRSNRFSPLPRKIISFVSRLTVSIFYGSGVRDVNAPFRLMRGEFLSEIAPQIPEDTFAPNLIISGWVNLKKVRIYQEAVRFYDRETGEVSIKKWKLFKAAVKSFAQTIAFRLK